MVDSIGSSGQISNITSINKSQKSVDSNKSSDVADTGAVDDVNISDEAFIAQATDAAKLVSEGLANDTSATLSSDASRLNELI